MREFVTAAEKADEPEQKELEWTLDGTLCRAFFPKPGQLAVLLATTGKHSSQNEQIAGIINFFVAVCDDQTHAYIVSRLLDTSDPFDMEQVQDIMEWMVEEWTGNPTPALSVSTKSRKRTGPSSTPTTPALT